MMLLVIFLILVCVGLISLLNEYPGVTFVVLLIIGLMSGGMIMNGQEAAPAYKAEIESLRQTLITHGLATYTPVVVEKKFEMIVPSAEKKEEVK